MGIIADVKCARCDRKYSGLRSRCPYCGARRIGGGKYSDEDDNSKGKMIIGILVLAVLVVAAGVLLFTSQEPPETTEPPDSDPESTASETVSEAPPSNPDDTGNTVASGLGPSVPPTEPVDSETPPPSPSVAAEIESIEITYQGTRSTDFTATVGEQVQLRVRVEPAGVEFTEEIVWESSDTSVFEVVPDDITGTSATVTITGPGNESTLTVSIGDIKATCTVRGSSG